MHRRHAINNKNMWPETVNNEDGPLRRVEIIQRRETWQNNSLISMSPSNSKPSQQKKMEGHRTVYGPAKTSHPPTQHFLSGRYKKGRLVIPACCLSQCCQPLPKD